MSRLPVRSSAALFAAAAVLSCAAPHANVKPPPPGGSASRPISDPPPSRVVIHATVFRDGLVKKLAESLPRQGDGEAELVAGQTLRYTWQRQPLGLRFDRGRIFITVPVVARFNLLGDHEIPITVTVAGEPVVTADFKALLQSNEVNVQATGSVEAVNRAVEAKLRGVISKTLDEFRFDLRPTLNQAFARLAKPIEFSVGDQVACAELRIAALEAAPTVLADGVEKDLAAVVMPSVTLPCTPVASVAVASGTDGGTPSTDGGLAAAPASGTGTTPVASATAAAPVAGTTAPATSAPSATPASGVAPAGGSTASAQVVPARATAPAGGTVTPASASAPVATVGGSDGGTAATPAAPAPLPLLANVAALPTGPFKVVVPVAARYEELSRALEKSMGGRLFFSRTYPELYLEKPAVYPSDDTVVIRMVLGGKAQVAGLDTTLSGEIFFAGHPHVIDNQIVVPDLDITPGTADELVKLKFALDYTSIRDQAREAMRVDVSERLAAVKDKLSTELSFDEGNGCVRAQVLRSEVTGIYPHPSFLRIYTQVDAQAAMYMPCKK